MYKIADWLWYKLNRDLPKGLKYQQQFTSGNIEKETDKAVLVTLYFGNYRYDIYGGKDSVWIPKSCLEEI